MAIRRVVVIVTSSPFATLNNYEALRFSLGLFDMKVSLVWSGKGVCNAIKGVDHTLTRPFIRVFPDLDIDLYVDKSDLQQEGMGEVELIPEVKALEKNEVIELVCQADLVITF